MLPRPHVLPVYGQLPVPLFLHAKVPSGVQPQESGPLRPLQPAVFVFRVARPAIGPIGGQTWEKVRAVSTVFALEANMLRHPWWRC